MRRVRLPKRPTPNPEPGPSARLAFDDLEEELEIVCLDALRGDPPGPAVATRLQRECIALLRSKGIDAEVHAVSTRQGTAVQVLLKAGPDRVKKLVLQVG